MKAAAVLIGDLSMLRSFTGTGVPTVVVSRNPDDVTFRSRYCRESATIPDPVIDPEGTVSALERIAEGRAEPPVLYYGDDAMLLLLSRHRDRLEGRYRFLMPPPELVEACADKTRFQRLGEERSLPVPPSVPMGAADSSRRILSVIEPPVAVKPGTGIGWFQSEAVRLAGGKPSKIFLASTPEELDEIRAILPAEGETFIVQQYIPGGEEQIYSYHAYRRRGGELLGSYVGKKIRTYPALGGISTFVELVNDTEVDSIGRAIVESLGVVGVVKIDFKKDPRDGRLYVLELNLRFNLWNHLGSANGVNLPLLAYLDNCGLPCRPQGRAGTRLRWLAFGNDLRAMVRDYRPAGLTWWRWLSSITGPKVHEMFAWRDPWPFLVHLGRYLGLVTAKVLGRSRE